MSIGYVLQGQIMPTTVIIVVSVTIWVREIVVLRVAGRVKRRLRAHRVSTIVQVIIVVVGVRVVVRRVACIVGMHRGTAVQRVRNAVIVWTRSIIVKYLFLPRITTRRAVHTIRYIVNIVCVVIAGKGTFVAVAWTAVAASWQKPTTYTESNKKEMQTLVGNQVEC